MSETISEKKIYYTAVGRRKTAIAKIEMSPGTGIVYVNNKPGDLYFQYNSQYIRTLKAPLTVKGLENSYDLDIIAKGGGLSAQTEAVRLGVARALCKMSIDMRSILKKDGFLARDARSKERKKYGLRKARRAPQFSKR